MAAASGEPMPVGVLLRIVADAAAGAHAAHQLRGTDGTPLGIVHRDVSPHNVLVGIAGASKLIDFGIAKSALRQATGTRTGKARGKPSYLAPEQAMKFGIDHRADVWALGASLYRALQGRPPFDDVAQLVAYVYKGTVIAPMARHVPGLVEAIVTRALAVDPVQRFETAEEMRDALEQTMIDLGISTTQADVGRYVASLKGEATSHEIDSAEGTSAEGDRSSEPTANERTAR